MKKNVSNNYYYKSQLIENNSAKNVLIRYEYKLKNENVLSKSNTDGGWTSKTKTTPPCNAVMLVYRNGVRFYTLQSIGKYFNESK